MTSDRDVTDQGPENADGLDDVEVKRNTADDFGEFEVEDANGSAQDQDDQSEVGGPSTPTRQSSVGESTPDRTLSIQVSLLMWTDI